ncbi:MAG: TIGR01459 family HAD-type hydrolase [Pseudomonadota bacterium]
MSELTERYKGILCDVWGVLHNGVSVYTAANDALVQYRAQGGRVVLITNSPRPNGGVIEQLRQLGVDDEAWDDIVTSGDVTRELIKSVSGPVFLLGPDRDLPLFDGLDTSLSDAANASAVVCTGLFHDETETPDDYRDMLADFKARDLPFICANPDLVVERGDRLIYCAGSLAQAYEEIGGTVHVAGKPHKPIYDAAFAAINRVDGSQLKQSDLVAIGDGMPTDVAGALGNGFDLLYITAGIHAAEYGAADAPDETKLAQFLLARNADPTYWMPRLNWQDG